MKQLFIRKFLALGRLSASVGAIIALAVVGILSIPAARAAACDSSQITASDGSCCDPGQYTISNGSITCTSGSNCSDSAPSESCLITRYVNPAIVLLSSLVGVTVIANVVYGAIQYITSGGDPGKTAAGKKKITNALIGLGAFIMLFAFLEFILPGGVLNGK